METSKLLDRRIASTWLTAQKSGDVGSKFIISLFASCGKAPVLLEGDEFAVKCIMWLTGGTLHLDFEGCTVALNAEKLSQNAPTFLQENTFGNLDGQKQADPTKLGLSISPAKGEFSADLEHSFTGNPPDQREYTKYSRHRLWEAMGPQDLLLGANSSVLVGMVVPGVAGWTIDLDQHANRTVVTSRMLAQEEFCNFKLLPPETVGAKINRRIWAFFSTATARERKMFSALLEKLASKGLVSSETDTALLSEHTLLIEKGQEPKFEPVSALRHAQIFKIFINTKPLFQFVSGRNSERLDLLQSHGVPITEFSGQEVKLSAKEKVQVNTEQGNRLGAGQLISSMIDKSFKRRGDFAQEMNVSSSTLSHLLHGRKKITAEIAQRLADLLDESPEFFLQLEAQVVASNQEVKPQITRRKRSNSYDFLLLEALLQKESYGHPVGLSALFELAQSFDRSTKRPSLTAKLNRWRHDKQWITWLRSDDIDILPAGQEERDRLLGYVRREGEANLVSELFKSEWGVEPKL